MTERAATHRLIEQINVALAVLTEDAFDIGARRDGHDALIPVRSDAYDQILEAIIDWRIETKLDQVRSLFDR